MTTKYITYQKECPAEENKATEFEFKPIELKEEHDSYSHELVNVLISGNKIYYTFRIDIRIKGVENAGLKDEDEEVSPFER